MATILRHVAVVPGPRRRAPVILDSKAHANRAAEEWRMKIAVSGIGIAGTTLAYWLRCWGHEPVMFERAPALRTGGYLIDFWGLGYEIAERMGIMPALRDRCYLMEEMRMVDADGRVDATLDVRPMREMLGGRFISLARADLAAALFGTCDGIPAHFGVWFTAVEEDDAGVVVTLSDGRRERFDLVVGADGVHSQVRALVFGPEARFEQSLGCHVAAFRLRGYPHRDELVYVSHTVKKRQVARVALRDDETLVLLIFRDELLPDEPSAHQRKAALRHVFGDMRWEVPEILNAMDALDDLYFDRISQVYLARWSSGRVALVGDAGACPSLLAGEGTGLAMVEAYVLAGELHRANGDSTRAFDAYEDRLRAFVTGKQKAAPRFRGFFAPDTTLGLMVRNISMKALSFRVFASRFLARSLHDDFDLPAFSADEWSRPRHAGDGIPNDVSRR